MHQVPYLHLHLLDYWIWGAMPEKYKACTPLTTNSRSLKAVLEQIWKDWLQAMLDLAVLKEAAGGGHCEYLLTQRSTQKLDPFRGQTNSPFRANNQFKRRYTTFFDI